MTWTKILTTVLTLPLIVLSIACSTPTSPAGPQEAGAVSAAAPAPSGPITVFADGDYEVGSGAGQVPVGKYKTTAPKDGLGCYWARLKGLGGELSDVKANANIAAGAPGIMTIVAADKGIKVSGGCTWQRA